MSELKRKTFISFFHCGVQTICKADDAASELKKKKKQLVAKFHGEMLYS